MILIFIKKIHDKGHADWYLDADEDGLGEDMGGVGYVAQGCEYPGSDEFPLVDNNDDPCPNDELNLDEDQDGICEGLYAADIHSFFGDFQCGNILVWGDKK